MREALSLSASDYVITFVGELSKRKNQSLLIEAMQDIKAEVPTARLLLVGEGSERARLEALVKRLRLSDSVQLLGRREDVADIISAVDLYVSPSKSEGLPFNVAEAMAKRKTVVASRVKGHVDLIESGVSGYLFTAGNRRGLVECILRAKSAEPLCEAKIYSACEKHCFDNVYSDTLDKIKSLIL